MVKFDHGSFDSDALAAIHETMEALHDAGAINKQTMREFDETCLTPVHTLSPEEIKALRLLALIQKKGLMAIA